MTVAICTDSSALLTAPEAAGLGVDVVPIAVTLDGEPFDELMSSLDWFYERMRAGAVATTSQPSPASFSNVFQRAAERGADKIVSIHLDARISGTVSAAELAAQHSPVPVVVVDTRTVSYGVGLCVRAAAAALAERGAAGDAARAASRLGATLANAFAVRAGPGGRIAEGDEWTLFHYLHGAAERISIWPSLEEAAEQLLRHAVAGGVPTNAAVGHAGRDLEPFADALAQGLRAHGTADIERYRLGASVAAHTGPDCFGLFWSLATRQ